MNRGSAIGRLAPSWACGIVLLLLALCAPRLADASERKKTALNWVRGAGAELCISPPELARRVEQHVGPVLVAAPEGDVNVEGRIERRSRGFVAHIVVSGADGAILGERKLTGKGGDCRALDAEIVFVIAVAIDPNAALSELPGELAPNPERDPGAELLSDMQSEPPAKPVAAERASRAPEPKEAAEPKDAPEPEARRPAIPLSFAAGLSAVVGAFTLEQPVSVGARLELEVALGDAAIVVDGSLWLPDEQTLSVPEGATVTLRRADVGLVACPIAFGVGALVAQPCAGLLGSWLAAEHVGFVGQDASRPLLGPRLALRSRLPLGLGVELRAQLEVWSQWPRHRFVYGQAGEPVVLHEVAPLSAALSLGGGVRF